MNRYWFVHDHQAEFPIDKLCELIELPRANYYRWAKPVLSYRYLNDAYLSNEIFNKSRRLARAKRRPIRDWTAYFTYSPDIGNQVQL